MWQSLLASKLIQSILSAYTATINYLAEKLENRTQDLCYKTLNQIIKIDEKIENIIISGNNSPATKLRIKSLQKTRAELDKFYNKLTDKL